MKIRRFKFNEGVIDSVMEDIDTIISMNDLESFSTVMYSADSSSDAKYVNSKPLFCPYREYYYITLYPYSGKDVINMVEWVSSFSGVLNRITSNHDIEIIKNDIEEFIFRVGSKRFDAVYSLDILHDTFEQLGRLDISMDASNNLIIKSNDALRDLIGEEKFRNRDAYIIPVIMGKVVLKIVLDPIPVYSSWQLASANPYKLRLFDVLSSDGSLIKSALMDYLGK